MAKNIHLLDLEVMPIERTGHDEMRQARCRRSAICGNGNRYKVTSLSRNA